MVPIIIIITTLTKSKQLPLLGYQKSDRKSKKKYKKYIGFRAAFQTGPNLKNILYKNKDKLITNSYPGVYELKSSCESLCNDETKKNIISRSIEEDTNKKQENIKGNWSSSGATEHTMECPVHFDW